MKLASLAIGLSLTASSVLARGVGMEMPRITIPENSEIHNGKGNDARGHHREYNFYLFSDKDKNIVYIAYPICDGKMLEKPFGIYLDGEKRKIFYVDYRPYDGFIDQIITDEGKLEAVNVSEYLPDCPWKI